MVRLPHHQKDYDMGDKRIKRAVVYAKLYYEFGVLIDIRYMTQGTFKRNRLI